MDVLRDGSFHAGHVEPNDGTGKFRACHRILVVDDNHDAAESMRVLLKLMGAEARAAFDGLEALEVAATFHPEAVLLDIGMPKLHGYDTARRFRQEEWGKDIVLVALTGWGREEDRRRAEEAGFDGHLIKPVQVSALRHLLERLLDRTPRQG
ncbi:MAG TPA: response regulator [Planctomycetaceae bacterium]|jgi:CheY-like chemotaxis protein|nr:response regulator [Planctomycetaceae bacterium]